MKKIRLLTAVAVLCTSASTFAAMSVPYGWYLEGNAGQSRISQNYTNGTADRNGFGWNANAGYKFSPFIAGEVGYTHYADVSIRNTFGSKAASNSHYSYDIAAKGILPVGVTGFELFVKVGAARMNSNLSITSYPAVAVGGMVLDTGTHMTTGWYFGGGGEYSFTPNMLLNLQWARANGSSSTGTGNLYSAGLSYLF